MTASDGGVTLGALARWMSGGTPSRSRHDYWDGDIPWISAATLKLFDVRDSGQRLTAAGVAAGSQLAPPGATLLLVRGMSVHKEVRVGVATRAVAFNQDVKALVPVAGVVPRFLAYAIAAREHAVLRLVTSAGSGTGVLQTGALHRLMVWLPEEREQAKIAEAIDDATAQVLALERLLTKKEAIKQGLMQELLTGRTRLPGFEGEWASSTLGEVAHVKTGSRNNQDKNPMGRYPFFVRSPTVERIDSFSYDCEAILVPGEGNIGSIFHYVNGKFDVHQRVYKISHFSSGVDGRFLFHYLHQFFGRHALENSVKATVDSLRLPTFTRFALHMPPTADEQRAIAQVLTDADDEIAALRSRLDKAKAIKQGMMQELLTGRARLPIPGGAGLGDMVVDEAVVAV